MSTGNNSPGVVRPELSKLRVELSGLGNDGSSISRLGHDSQPDAVSPIRFIRVHAHVSCGTVYVQVPVVVEIGDGRPVSPTYRREPCL